MRLHSAMRATTLFLVAALAASAFAGENPRTLLGRLEGRWLMSGEVRGKSVAYNAEGTWILGGGFLAFHMTDTAIPPSYEATLFMGVDTAKKEFVGHWLDVTGGAGARVAATGPFAPDTIRLVYPYAEGKFRNCITFEGAAGKFVIDMERTPGIWSPFASYILTRRQ